METHTRADTVPPVNDPAPRLLRLADLLTEWDADALARYEAKQTGKPLGPVAGLPSLDAALGGALAPGLHILHGVPGVGKTAFALQVAALCGCPCLYVTCEMSALELLRRVTARVTGTFLGKLKTGELLPDFSRQLVRQAVRDAPALALLDATTAPAPAAVLLDMANTARHLAPENPHLLLIVDSLHSWAEANAGDKPEYEALNDALAALRGIAARLSCPVLTIAERNRASMSGGGLSAGAGSRKIEYGAESVIDLDTEKSDGKDAPIDANGEKPVTLKIGKNRNGAAGKKIDLRFHGALQRYAEEKTW